MTLQTAMAEALMSGRCDAVTGAIEPGLLAAAESLAVHRNTAIYGLVNALRISHPTVDALVGADFFDQAARDFVQAHPPTSAWLTGYGERFAEFLETYEPVRELPYLADVAQFDFAVEQVALDVSRADGPSLDLGEAVLALDGSLRLVDLNYPVAAIRDALAEDEDRLATLDMRGRRHALALWRLPEGTGVRELCPSSAVFVAAMLAGEDPGGLLAEADLDALQSEVFAAPFARISLKA